MAKFNTQTARARSGNSVLGTLPISAPTFNGGQGALRDPKSELFLALVSEFGGEKTFYESSEKRLARITALVKQVSVADPAWVTGLSRWLRQEGNLRSASIILAANAAKALIDAGTPGARTVIANAISRADEPGEMLAYWMANFGRKIPIAVKRGIADAAVRSYNEYSLAKYDTDSKGFRFSDVISLTHPTPKDEEQSALFKFALDRRRDSSVTPPEALGKLTERARILGLPLDEKRKLLVGEYASERLAAAGLTWEAVAGSFGKGGLDAKAWEALIPTMGYMALLRNLRNFEQAGVSDVVLNAVSLRLADPEQVAKSRQMPFRFLSAYQAVTRGFGSLRFAWALEQALNASLSNVPSLKGKTLILVDRSGSMFWKKSENTEMSFADTAALFGTALALRAENATLVEYGSGSREVALNKGASVLKAVESFHDMGGTDTHSAVRNHYNGHQRVIILTDEQHSGRSPYEAVPANTNLFVWNLLGYSVGSGTPAPNRVHMGGLTDKSFATIELVERGLDSAWPWEV